MMTYFGVKVTIFVSPVLDISICKMNWRRKGKVTHVFFFEWELNPSIVTEGFDYVYLGFPRLYKSRNSTCEYTERNENQL